MPVCDQSPRHSLEADVLENQNDIDNLKSDSNLHDTKLYVKSHGTFTQIVI